MSPFASLRHIRQRFSSVQHRLSSSCTPSPPPSVKISAAETPATTAELQRNLQPLLERWTLTPDGRGIERVVRFKTFGACWKWMSTVATECKRTKHHPEWTNVYSRTHIRWTTHSPPGLSGKDVAMAKFCDEAAAETEVAATATQVEEDKTMMQTMRMGADECCTRKVTQ